MSRKAHALGRVTAILVPFVACAPDVGSSARVPSPPAEVAHVGLVELDEDGNWRAASALVPSDSVHVFPGPIEAAPDGHRLRLVGYTDAQLAVCNPREEVELAAAKLEATDSPTLALPSPAWAVEGTWSSSYVDLSDLETPELMSSAWLSNGVDSCSTNDIRTTTVPHEFGNDMFLLLRAKEGKATMFSRGGQIIGVDVDTLSTTLLSTTSTAEAVVGGFVDDDDTQWLFRRDGRLERVDVDGQVNVVERDGPWRDAKTVFGDGRARDGRFDIFALVSTGRILHYDGDGWDVLLTVEPRKMLEHIEVADVLWRTQGRALLVHDSSFSVYALRPGQVMATEIGNVEVESPVTIIETERYGVVVGTSVGALFQSYDAENWRLLVRATDKRNTRVIHEVGGGVFFGGGDGAFRFVFDDLEPCPYQRYAATFVSTGVRFGSRVILTPTDGGDPTIIGVDFNPTPYGCQ